MPRSPEYRVWTTMCQRCHNPEATNFENYGARGITVCTRWRGPGGFKNFIADVGPRPSGPNWTIERIDNDLGYAPDNCRWATRKEQQANKRFHRNQHGTFPAQ